MSDTRAPAPIWRRPDAWVGLIFCSIAGAGLYISNSYAMGTAVRMGTGYVPRLLCIALLTLGAIVLLQALVTRPSQDELLGAKDGVVLRPLFFVTLATVVFALGIETLGLIITLVATMAVGSMATKTLRPIETTLAIALLTAACWGIFSYGLAVPFPVWPRF